MHYDWMLNILSCCCDAISYVVLTFVELFPCASKDSLQFVFIQCKKTLPSRLWYPECIHSGNLFIAHKCLEIMCWKRCMFVDHPQKSWGWYCASDRYYQGMRCTVWKVLGQGLILAGILGKDQAQMTMLLILEPSLNTCLQSQRYSFIHLYDVVYIFKCCWQIQQHQACDFMLVHII